MAIYTTQSTSSTWDLNKNKSRESSLTACHGPNVVHVLWVVCFIFFLSVTRPKLTLSQILNHATCDVYSPKAVETLIHRECYGYYFLYLCVKYIFFWFYRSVGFKGYNKYMYAKKRYYLSHGMR